MTARSITTDPDVGVPDLVRRLRDDSKRLVADEIRLARLETADSVSRAARGVLWLALAFGVAVVMIVALTIFLTTLIGSVANGHMWLGATVTGVLEIAIGAALVKRGGTEMKSMVSGER